jgi:superfamily II DNA or RNA helicase
VLQQFPADFRYGVTATPDRRDGLGPFIELVIGPVRHTVTAEELHDDGILVVPEIVWLKTDFRCFADEWVDLISALVTNERRNHFILEAVLRLIDDGRRIIALSERVNHVEALADAINRSRPGAAVVVTGSMGRKKSDAAMSRIMSGEARVLLSTKLADEGLDIPDLNALVLLTPTRNGGRTIQRAGRILRAVSGKSQPVIYDIVDPLVGILWSQARTRFLEAYKNIAPGCNLPEWLERSKRQVA